MKRSSMIKVLADSFWDRMNDDSILSDTEMYSAILADLEEAGMLPPEIVSKIYLRSECDYMWINEWDKET